MFFCSVGIFCRHFATNMFDGVIMKGQRENVSASAMVQPFAGSQQQPVTLVHPGLDQGFCQYCRY